MVVFAKNVFSLTVLTVKNEYRGPYLSGQQYNINEPLLRYGDSEELC